MDLNDFRRIIDQLNESERLGEDPAVEDLIERTLQGVDPHTAGEIRDALDVLKLKQRLSLRSWILGLMDYRSAGTENLSAEQAREILKQTVKMFYGQVLRRGKNPMDEEIWVWDANPAAPRERELPVQNNGDPYACAKTAMLNHAQTTDSFTLGSLSRVAMKCGLPSARAYLAANEFVMDHTKSITTIDSDHMRWKRPRGTVSRGDYGQTFRGWADDALNNPNGLGD